MSKNGTMAKNGAPALNPVNFKYFSQFSLK